MRVCGVICEYNPFHRGHALHLEHARALSGAHYVVCAMSGSVTQRGSFARHDKWTRAHAALLGGADLVLELPARFACSGAQDFAAGGVSLLASLGVLTHLSFGCEADSLPYLKAAAAALSGESPVFRQALREGLDAGLPYPRARARAAQAASGMENLEAVISNPNAALAIEYLRALPESIVPVPVKRQGCGYHEQALSELASATAVRAAFSRGDTQSALDALPIPQRFARSEALGDVHAEEALTQALLYRLRTMTAQELAQIEGVEEGLEHRFLAAARTASSRDELILSVKSKRSTYARVLGFKKSAAPLLRAVKDSASIPLVTKAADYDRADPLFALDVRAQDLWSLGCASAQLRGAGRDFTTSPIIL